MVSCAVKDFVDTLKGQLVAEKTKWPLVIDNAAGVAGTFLRYRDCNCLNAQNPLDLQEPRLRLALLGSMRYGKYFVIDLGDTDMFNFVFDSFNRIQEGLFELVMNRKITDSENFMKLVKPEDGDEYKENKFSPTNIEEFAVVFITRQTSNLPATLLEKTVKITIQ